MQVKRLLPDPPSVRGVQYPRDPTIVLDDRILRPGSPAPAMPAAVAAPARSPLPVPSSAVAVPMHATQRPGSRMAASAADVAAELAEMEIDDAPALPSVPVNQQRKTAIRAAAQAGAGGLAAALGGMGRAAGSALSSALQARPSAALAGQPGEGNEAAIAASPGPADRQRDWLQSVFGKGLTRHGQHGSGSGVGATTGSALTSGPAVEPSQQLRQAGYLRQYIQQQQRISGSDGGKPGSGAAAIFLMASSSSAADTAGADGQPVDACTQGETQLLDMRASKLTVRAKFAFDGISTDTDICLRVAAVWTAQAGN